MAKFECHNCGHEFEKFCDDAMDATNIECPSCQSHWTNIIFREQKLTFPKLPCGDQPYPKPNFGPFPYDPPAPWPRDGWTVTCGDRTGRTTKPKAIIRFYHFDGVE